MTAEDFIKAAIDKGQFSGLANLDSDERLVYLISEAEVSCDMDGIDTLLDSYTTADLEECASSFAEVGASEIATALREMLSALPAREETSLSKANSLIADRVGYDYDAIREAVGRRLSLTSIFADGEEEIYRLAKDAAFEDRTREFEETV